MWSKRGVWCADTRLLEGECVSPNVNFWEDIGGSRCYGRGGGGGRNTDADDVLDALEEDSVADFASAEEVKEERFQLDVTRVCIE